MVEQQLSTQRQDQGIQTTAKADRLKTIMRSAESIQRFAEVVGGERNASHYISSVLVAVSLNEQLSQCTPVSIMQSAMRAASLKLTVDPTVGHAYLVPFRSRDGLVATFLIGYRGYIQLALRTGKYRYLNVATIHEGQVVEEDQLRGIHRIAGRATSTKPIGYMLYIEMTSSFKKTFYMTVEQIAEHAERYSKTYTYEKSAWQTNFHEMCQKTLIRLGLSKYGYFDPSDYLIMQTSDEAVPGDEVSEEESWMIGVVNEAEELKKIEPPLTIAEGVSELGFEVPTESTSTNEEMMKSAKTFTRAKDNKHYSDLKAGELQETIDDLQSLLTKDNTKNKPHIEKRLKVARFLLGEIQRKETQS